MALSLCQNFTLLVCPNLLGKKWKENEPWSVGRGLGYFVKSFNPVCTVSSLKTMLFVNFLHVQGIKLHDSPYSPTSIFKRLVLQAHKNQCLFEKEITLSCTALPSTQTPKESSYPFIPNDENLASSKFNANPDNRWNVARIVLIGFERVEKIMRKGENVS